MKTSIGFLSNRLLRLGLLSLAACLLAVPSARAGLTVTMEVAHEIDNGFPPYSSTNYQILLYDVEPDANLPAAPLGGYLISSPSGAYSESFQLTGGGISDVTGGYSAAFSDYNSFIQELTNGFWTILVTNATSTNLYKFTIKAPSFTSNSLPDVNILVPAVGAVNVTNNPLFTWQRLPSWGGGDIQVEDNNTESGFSQEDFLSTTQSNWTSPAILPDGPNNFYVTYVSSLSTSVFIASTPTNNLSQPISAWTFQSFLDSYAISAFTVGNHAPGFPGVTPLVAHYTFDDGNLAATDVSGNGNTLSGFYSDSGGSVVITNDSRQGAYAVAFSGPYAYSGGDYYTDNTNLLAALSGSFSVSIWVKTTQVAGNNTDDGIYNGAGIVSALAWNHTFDTNYVNPMILTGSKLAFVTVGGDGTVQDTLHSATSINSGSYVHVVVTRDQGTGEKDIYVNGALDASDTSTTDLLNGSAFLQIGLNNGQGFNGKLDDIQFYSTALSADQVLQLYNNPGSTVFTNGNVNPSDLVSNGGFETGDFSGWTDDGSGSVTTDSSYVQSGTYGAEFGAVGSLGYIYQTLSTTPGTNYLLSFWLDSPDGLTPNEFLVSWNGTTLLDETNLPAIGWTNIQFVVTATGASTVLEFGFRDDPTELGLDDVSVTTTNIVSAAPVSASFDLVLVRRENFIFGYHDYSAIPEITSISPIPVTTNRIESSDGAIFGEVYTGHSSWDNATSSDYTTLDQLIYACTNGQWTLYINKGHPSEQAFHFKVSMSGLTTNLLASVNVLMPTNNAVNVATNTPFQWAGPVNFSSIFVNAYQLPSFASAGYANLPGNATSWPSPPTLSYGTNGFTIICTSNNFPNVTFTTPLDVSLNPISSWSAEADLQSSTEIPFVVGAPAPLPVQLISSPPITSGGDFLLSFQTLAGRPETVQISTNLTTGWMDVTNFIGDGSVHQFTFPTSNAPGEYFRVITQ